jgi:transmembrane sensor
MNNGQTRIAYLLEQYASKRASEEEENELFALISESNNEKDVKHYLLQLQLHESVLTDLDRKKWEPILGKILHQEQHEISQYGRAKKPVVKIWRRWAVAASIILALGVGSYFVFFNKSEKKNDLVKTNDTVPYDVAAPSVAKATLKLDDGRIVYLDSAKNGSLALQGNINIVKLADGQIAYQGKETDNSEVKYNTITNYRGSKVQPLTLIDGTKVWLNTESSLTYPTTFTGKERKVSITGEAYFEVSKDPLKKFIVDANGVTTEVLGTHFNVNSYSDEGNIKVTLLEGSVRITQNTESKMIKPGEQAIASSNEQLKTNKNVDVDEVMAWKNGRFKFNNADIQTIMRQVSKWYDLNVEYEHGVPEGHYQGTTSREVSAAEMLAILKYSGIKFRIEGKRLIIE